MSMRAGTRASQLATQWRDRFTRHSKRQALVGWQSHYHHFLETAPASPLVDHRGPYLGDEARHAKLIDALAAGRRAVLISAPAGCGKSRLALELARQLGRSQRSWDVRFVRHDEPALGEELQELPQGGRLILIVDDAHDCPALVQRLAALCSEQGRAQTHLVCLTRPAGRAALIEALASHLPVDEPLQIDLGRPDPKVIRGLIDALIPQMSPHHRDVIRRFVADSFFAAVLLCSSVARQKKLPQTLSTRNLRDYAVRQPIAQAIGDLCPPNKAFRALAAYAACAPVRAGDAAIRSSAATHAALPVAAVEALERSVLQAGLFEVDGRGLMRPLPDLVGDLILEETCLDEEGRPTPFGQSLLRSLLEQRHYEPVIFHCSEVARLFSKPEPMDFLGERVLELAHALSPQHRAPAAELLDGCAGLAVRQPAVIVHLIEALTASGVLRAVPPALEPSPAPAPEIRAQRLLTSAGEAEPAIVPRALEYSRQLLAPAGAGDDRNVLGSLAESCQFALARPLAHAEAVLDVLRKWSEDSDPKIAALSASLVSGFLRLEMRTRRWEQNVPAFAWIALEPAEDVGKLRDEAVDILVRCANHTSPAVAHAAVSAVRYWAHGYQKLTPELRQRWAPQLNRELDLLAAALGRLGAATADLPVRAAIEQLGWQWWLHAEAFIGRAGSRLLEVLPAAEAYSLWKALHAARLPIFPLPRDESIEPQRRPEHLLPVIEPSAARAADLARELLDRLDLMCRDPASWSALFASAVGALPRQPLQPRAHLHLKEFARRHPDGAWSFVSEEAAQGPLGAILPVLLAELRGQDTPRWHVAIQSAQPGTRLFAMQLRALCASGELDPVERAVVSRGLELDDAEIVHLCAQALLSAAHSALAPGLEAVFASLPRRSSDARLWELTLDAFARWGGDLLASPAGEEAETATRTASGELLRLLRTCGSSLHWDQGAHTRRLATVLAIFAVAIPHTLKSWIRQECMPSADRAGSGLVLTPARFSEVALLLSKSSAAVFWQKQFIEWMTEEPGLAGIAARGLAQLCGLGEPCIAALVMRIARQPSESSLEALRELIGSYGSSPRLVEDALGLLRQLTDAPEACELLEKEIIAAVARADRTRAGAVGARKAALEAIERAARDEDFPQPLRETLARARQAIQASIEEGLLSGQAR
jgi:DNA polymerase III delta prime subunit